jgi:hypothetical protein
MLRTDLTSKPPDSCERCNEYDLFLEHEGVIVIDIWIYFTREGKGSVNQ